MEFDIIDEKLVNKSQINKIDNIIKISKGTVKIELTNGEKGSGFFLKFNRNNKPFYCLMTNQHVITSDMVNRGENILIKYENETKTLSIKLNSKNRNIQCFKGILNLDVTVIEIISKDKINNSYFLSPNLDYSIPYYQSIGSLIQVVQYPKGGQISYSDGKIAEIYSLDKNVFFHSASTEGRSSGSPIVFQGEETVLAIHKGTEKQGDYNVGIFIKTIIDKIKESNVKPKNNNNNINTTALKAGLSLFANFLHPFANEFGLNCTNCLHLTSKHIAVPNTLGQWKCMECDKICKLII